MRAFFATLLWSFTTAVLLIAAVVGAGMWAYHDSAAPGPLAAPRTVIVPPHTGVAGIAALLHDQGVIRHPRVFEIVAKFSGRGGALKSGEYEFPAKASALQAMDILASGKTVKHRLTIPEGLTTGEVVALVRAAPALSGDVTEIPGEGELLPETYVYSYGDQRQELIDRMRRAMAEALSKAWASRRPDLALTTPQQALILASVVEKETGRDEERAHIAGVFVNRLRLGMKLQSDPTVIYALLGDKGGKLDRPLSRADLEVQSPYNTYIAKGLPQGPIDNPGKSALRAATRPERSEDMYFAAAGRGEAAAPRAGAPADALGRRGMGVSSMTGFAREAGEAAGITWVWELKSVNGRSLDLRLRLPPGFDALEMTLRAALGRRFRRGSISATLTVARTQPPAIRINRDALGRILALLGELSGEIEAAAPPRLDGLLNLRGVIETVDDEDEAIVAERHAAILAGWTAALDRLHASRGEEGARLDAVLAGQLGELSGLVAAAADCAAAQPEAIRARLAAQIAELGELVPALPPERLAQEAAMLITRADIREELDRLRAHLAQAGDLLRQGEAVGRQLDFLCQELNREANTLCSKSADIELTRIGLALKAAVEQFREQVQNLE